MNGESATKRFGFEAFACPQLGADDRIFDRYVDALMLALLRKARAALAAEDGESLYAWLGTVGARELPGCGAWKPVMGLIAAGLTGDDPVRRMQSAVQLALLLLEGGASGRWRVPALPPARLHFGLHVVELREGMRVESTGSEISIVDDVDAGAASRWLRTRGTVVRDGAALPPHLNVGGRLVPVYFASVDGAQDFCPHEHRLSSGPSATLVANLQAAVDAIATVSPTYLQWASRLLGAIVAVAQDGDKTDNGSESGLPGLIYLTDTSDPRSFACIVVHECTHQYFYLAEALRPVKNGLDNDMYYSPLKDTLRPLEMILIGYHADANILLFVDEAVDAELEDRAFYLEEQRQLAHDVALLESPLRATNGLSELGVALWRPIAELLRSRVVGQPSHV